MHRKTQPRDHAHRSAGTRRSHRRPFRHGAATVLPPAPLAGARALRRAQPGPMPDPIVLGAGTWLACGVVLLGLTPLPLRDTHLGWSFTFWALAAPLVVLLARCIRQRPS